METPGQKPSSDHPLTKHEAEQLFLTKREAEQLFASKADLDVTKTDLERSITATEVRLEQLIADQADVILEAMDERLDKKFDEKLSPIMSTLDKVLKEVVTHREENIVGAEQIRRHDDQLQNHEKRLTALELEPQPR